MRETYHHGDLRRRLLDLTAETVAGRGVSEVSLRSLARAAGVSHTAPRNHFGSRAGLLTAFATEGHLLLAERLREGAATSFLETGVAYVEFASAHPAHFAVMFSQEDLVVDDPAFVAARQQTFGVLCAVVEGLQDAGKVSDAAAAAIAGWSLVHGLATLALTGNLDASSVRAYVAEPDLSALARRAASMLYGSGTTAAPAAAERKEV